jgi:flavin reductase
MVASVETLVVPGCRPADFIDSMSRAVNGVSIVTTDGPHGRFGLTVSSMTSVSASPPMLLVCVNRHAVPHDAIRENGRFSINVLAASQQGMANHFAGRTEDAYTFDPTSWDTSGSLPRLRQATAWFECRLSSAMSFGSHTVFVGEVVAACAGEETPLLYTGRDYGRPVTLN